MKTVNNDPTIACPNANWNGPTTNYCNGVTSDDVVAHEWGHAYTQFTHDLIYQWQPGALNESYSDIWGETVDLINGHGTDAPARYARSDACSTHTPRDPRGHDQHTRAIARDLRCGGRFVRSVRSPRPGRPATWCSRSTAMQRVRRRRRLHAR